MSDIDRAVHICSFCPKLSRHACPVATVENRESSTPWGKMKAMKLVEDGVLPMDTETMALAYNCLECRASEAACELHNPVVETLHDYRVRAFENQVAPEPVYEFAKSFKKENNPYGEDLFQKLKNSFPEEMKTPQRITYFPGCVETMRDVKDVARALKLLKIASGEEIGLYREPIQCCAYPVYSAGDVEGFSEMADVNSHSLREYNLIVTGSAICAHTMDTLYREAGHPLTEVSFTTLTEFLASKNLPFKKGKSKEAVLYHDPCFLGRYRGVYDAPRKLLTQALGKPPLEFSLNREQSICCGGGGLLPLTNPEASEAITRMKIDEARSLGAKTLVTPCSTCLEQFRRHDSKFPIKSLVEILSDAL